MKAKAPKRKAPRPGWAVMLAAARIGKGFSQRKLAKQLGVSAGTVGGWECGDHNIGAEHIRPVANLVGLHPDQLVP